MLVWASSGGSGETARMRRLAWTFAARIGDKYHIRLTRSINVLLIRMFPVRAEDDRLSFSEVSLLIERQWTPFEERKKSFLHDLRKCRRRKGPMTRDELRQILQRGNAEALCDYDVDYVFKRLDLNHDNLITEEGMLVYLHSSRLMTKPTQWLCSQQRLRSVLASAQSDQSLCWSLIGS